MFESIIARYKLVRRNKRIIKPLQFMKEIYFDELVSTPIMSQINKRPNLR